MFWWSRPPRTWTEKYLEPFAQRILEQLQQSQAPWQRTWQDPAKRDSPRISVRDSPTLEPTVFTPSSTSSRPKVYPSPGRTGTSPTGWPTTGERIIRASGGPVRHVDGDRAAYSCKHDRVTLPGRGRFPMAAAYYRTLLHELAHATGHPQRLNRPTLHQAGQAGFDSQEHAREELRAEISALLTGVRVGVGHGPRHGDVYLQRWVRMIEADPRELLQAARDAQQMSDFLVTRGRALEAGATRSPPARSRVSTAGRPQPQPAPPPTAAGGASRSRPTRPVESPGAGGPRSSSRPRTPAGTLRLERPRGRVDRPGLSPQRPVHPGSFCAYFASNGAPAWRSRARRFVRSLLERGWAVEVALDGLPTTTRPCRIFNKKVYRALGLPNVRHRRTASAGVLMRRLLSLDYILEHPNRAWLPTEQEKVETLAALEIPKRLFPQRHYHGQGQGQSRYFALNLPLALEPQTATFVYVDPGHDSDKGLLSWGRVHAKLWQALRQQGRTLHVVAVARDHSRQERARKVLRRWTRRRVHAALRRGEAEDPPHRAGRPGQRPGIPRPVRRLRKGHGLPPDVARPARSDSAQKPHPDRPGKGLSIAPCSSGRRGLTGPFLSLSV